MGAERNAHVLESASHQMQIGSAGSDLAGLRIDRGVAVQNDRLGRQEIVISAPRLAQF